jgi:hypothetical protein
MIRLRPVVALTSSTVTPSTISRSAMPSSVISNMPSFVISNKPKLVATRLTTPRAVAGMAQRGERAVADDAVFGTEDDLLVAQIEIRAQGRDAKAKCDPSAWISGHILTDAFTEGRKLLS